MMIDEDNNKFLRGRRRVLPSTFNLFFLEDINLIIELEMKDAKVKAITLIKNSNHHPI